MEAGGGGEEGGREDSETQRKQMVMRRIQDEGQTYGAGTSPLILSLPLHLSLTHTLPLFTPTYTHVYAAGMPMRCEQSEHEAMQQFDCSGSLPRQTQTPQRQ